MLYEQFGNSWPHLETILQIGLFHFLHTATCIMQGLIILSVKLDQAWHEAGDTNFDSTGKRLSVQWTNMKLELLSNITFNAYKRLLVGSTVPDLTPQQLFAYRKFYQKLYRKEKYHPTTHKMETDWFI